MMKSKALALVCAALVAGPLFAGRPVAKWDVVPYQTVSGVFNVGVVAFHEKGVKVEFIINKKPRLVVDKPTLNERTGVTEYVFPFVVKKFKDGLVNINARVTAEGEEPYDLPPLPLYTNARGAYDPKKTVWVDGKKGNDFTEGTEDAPFKTLKQAVKKAGDGGRIYLAAGTYSLKMLGGGLGRKHWTLVTPAPGLKRGDVKLSAGRPGTDKLHFKDIVFYCDVDDSYGTIVMGEGGESSAWFENCTFTNLKGRYGGGAAPFGNKLAAYVTGGETSDIATGPFAELLRGHSIKSIAGTAFAGDGCLVANCTVEDVDAGPTDDPPDFFNAFAVPPKWVGDTIVYGVKASDVKCRAFSAQQLRDSAFVDVSFENLETRASAYCRFSEGLENVLFQRISAKGQHWLWMTSKNGRGDLKPKDVRLYDSAFGVMDGYAPMDGTKGLLVERCTFE